MASASALVLPDDVLRIVFDHFRHVETLPGGKVNWTALQAGHDRHYDQGILKAKPKAYPSPELKCLQSLRLVCKRFDALASPLLVPILRVSLDRQSLDNANSLVSNGRIRNGIRGVQVALDYCPKKLAQSIQEFEKYRSEHLGTYHLLAREEKVVKRVQRSAWRRAGSDDVFGSDDSEPNTNDLWEEHERKLEKRVERAQSMSGRVEREDPDDETLYQNVNVRSPRSAKANKQFHIIDRAWYSMGGRQYKFEPRNTRRPDRTNPHVKALERGFEAYCIKQKEQTQLIMSGEFVNSVTKMVSQIETPIQIAFVELDKFPKGHSPWEDPGHITKDALVMQDFLESPVPWDLVVSDVDDEETILPVKILTELPSAIHQAGGRIGGLAYWAFPSRNLSVLLGNPSNPPLTWENLRNACKDIDTLYLLGKENPMFYFKEPPNGKQDQEIALEFLRACMRGPHLEHVAIKPDFLELEEPADWEPARSNMRLRSGRLPVHGIFETLTTRKLRQFIFKTGEMSQSDVKTIINLMHDDFKEIALDTVVLTVGRWADVFDNLREKFDSLADDANRTVEFKFLADAHFNPDEEIGQEEIDKLEQAEDYVLGYEDENPLRDGEDDDQQDGED